MLIKEKSPSLPRNLSLRTFAELLIVFPTKVNLLYLLGMEALSSASHKAKLLAKNFSENSNLDDSGIFLPVFSSRTNLTLHNIYVILKVSLVVPVFKNLGERFVAKNYCPVSLLSAVSKVFEKTCK